MPASVTETSGDIMLVADPDRRLVFLDDNEIQRMPIEFEVLKYPMKNQGESAESGRDHGASTLALVASDGDLVHLAAVHWQRPP